MRLLKLLFLLCIISAFSNLSIGQEDLSKRKINSQAVKYLNDGKFEEALPLFLIVDSLEQSSNFITRYNIGICYLRSKYDKVKAIPHLEYAIKKDKFLIHNKVYLHLGDLFHLDYQFDRAITSYKIFIAKSGILDHDYLYAKRMVEVCTNAKQVLSDSLEVMIENIGPPINTMQSEFGPLIATDQSKLYYSFRTNPDLPGIKNGSDTLKHIMVSEFGNRQWKEPKEISFQVTQQKNLAIAGLSPEGEVFYVNIDGDLFESTVSEGNYSELKKLPEPINSVAWEGRVSLTADGQELFFSSDRAGGVGGLDIYKSQKDEYGNWETPINLGEAINTVYDEDAPFIHPDKHSLYFCSKGHTTIGGFDIFKSYAIDSGWMVPVNIGFPINTVTDDMDFVLSADGKSGYFSSCQNNKFLNHDIYKVYFKKSIPLTMVKGKIMAGDPAKPIASTIKVIDKETGKRVKYVYNPNPKTGKYLMIFPPDKNYQMIIEAKGYLPQLVDIFVPDQEYFHELFQEITLKPINVVGKLIGEEITVKNTFRDIQEGEGQDRDYSGLLDMIDGIISYTDSIDISEIDHVSENILNGASRDKVSSQNTDFANLFSMIDNAIESTSTGSSVESISEMVYDDSYAKKFFYGEDGSDACLVQVIIGNDTIYTTPAMQALRKKLEESDNHSAERFDNLGKIADNYKKVVFSYQIHYYLNDPVASKKYAEDLQHISELVSENTQLAIDLYAFADLTKEKNADEKASKALAFERALLLKDYFSGREISTKRMLQHSWDKERYSALKNKKTVELVIYEPMNKPVFEVILPEASIIDFSEADIKVEEVKEGQEIRLSNINFDYAKADLQKSSFVELDKVVQFLDNNNKLKIEIAGHTDDIGSDMLNLRLSKARAKSVADYLISKGVDSVRLVVNGYGKTKPVALNTTEVGRSKNRRVVFVILEK